jgi:hypothetical protein
MAQPRFSGTNPTQAAENHVESETCAAQESIVIGRPKSQRPARCGLPCHALSQLRDLLGSGEELSSFEGTIEEAVERRRVDVRSDDNYEVWYSREIQAVPPFSFKQPLRSDACVQIKNLFPGMTIRFRPHPISGEVPLPSPGSRGRRIRTGTSSAPVFTRSRGLVTSSARLPSSFAASSHACHCSSAQATTWQHV